MPMNVERPMTNFECRRNEGVFDDNNELHLYSLRYSRLRGENVTLNTDCLLVAAHNTCRVMPEYFLMHNVERPNDELRMSKE
jgi:hypothetical protein